jgi:hypothetical protein
MNDDDRAFERAIRGLVEDGSDRTPTDTIDAVLLAVRTTPQERDLRIPWRTKPMSIPMRLVAAFAILVVAGVAAFNLFRPTAGVGGVSGPTQSIAPTSPAPTSPAPTSPAPTASPQPTPFAIDLSTWTSYASKRYGFSIGHPADWTVRPATRAWLFPADANVYGPPNTGTENFDAANGDIGASAWSVAVKPGTTVDTWLQTYCPVAEYTSPCTTIQSLTVSASMDGHAGSLVRFTDDTQAFFLVNNRMYVVAIWRSEDFIPGGVSRLLEGYLSTMHLLPGGPAPSASPRPS